MCYTFAKQALAASCQVLWLVGTSVTDKQVASGLKKMGCEAATAYLREVPTPPNHKSKKLIIRSLSTEIATECLKVGNECDEEKFLKEVYSDVKDWLKENNNNGTPCWLILDDVSTLATILGETLVYQFIDSCFALSTRIGSQNIGIMIRCSHELDQNLLKKTNDDFEMDKTGWLGAGGLAHRQAVRESEQKWIPWERSIEGVDGIVDVVPLTSGYSREAHGRLIFTEIPGGRGWGESNKSQQGTVLSSTKGWNKLLFNYCIHDNGIRAIRLRV
jgi:hypothetical protein